MCISSGPHSLDASPGLLSLEGKTPCISSFVPSTRRELKEAYELWRTYHSREEGLTLVGPENEFFAARKAKGVLSILRSFWHGIPSG